MIDTVQQLGEAAIATIGVLAAVAGALVLAYRQLREVVSQLRPTSRPGAPGVAAEGLRDVVDRIDARVTSNTAAIGATRAALTEHVTHAEATIRDAAEDRGTLALVVTRVDDVERAVAADAAARAAIDAKLDVIAATLARLVGDDDP